MSGDHSTVTQALNAAGGFAAELRRCRATRRLSQKALARGMGYDPSYISKIENGQLPATRDFAQRADVALAMNGSLVASWRERATVSDLRPRAQGAGVAPPPSSAPQSLVVQHEQAECRYESGLYHLRMRRQLLNVGDEPVCRYLVVIAVDRHPGKSDRSNALYRTRPLTWEELQLSAQCEGEQLNWIVKTDRDANKEAWICLESDDRKLPLYPGQTTWLEYSYTVGEDKWGQWFQRAIRIPTERLSVELSFPSGLEPVVWATQTTMAGDAVPVRTPINQSNENGTSVFRWSTGDPPLHAHYRFEWRFRNRAPAEEPRPSDDMRRLGVVQRGDPILESSCEPFDLPAEAPIARSLGELLMAFLPQLRNVHNFSKGMGLAAPQIGVARRAAVVHALGRAPLVLYNARVIAETEETDQQYEGCLSFFDVRGLVERPLWIEVEHTTLDGDLCLMRFEKAEARLWAHEIDHLDGKLYTARMRAGVEPVPVERSGETSRPWTY